MWLAVELEGFFRFLCLWNYTSSHEFVIGTDLSDSIIFYGGQDGNNTCHKTAFDFYVKLEWMAWCICCNWRDFSRTAFKYVYNLYFLLLIRSQLTRIGVIKYHLPIYPYLKSDSEIFEIVNSAPLQALISHVI